ncbi:hypothetical protein Tco_1360431 [Tanacetum coccineum]
MTMEILPETTSNKLYGRSILMELKVQVKMEMEIPSSSRVRCFALHFVFCFAFIMPKLGIANATCTVTREEYTGFVDKFHIPSCYDHVLPHSYHIALDIRPGYVK